MKIKLKFILCAVNLSFPGAAAAPQPLLKNKLPLRRRRLII